MGAGRTWEKYESWMADQSAPVAVFSFAVLLVGTVILIAMILSFILQINFENNCLESSKPRRVNEFACEEYVNGHWQNIPVDNKYIYNDAAIREMEK